MSLISKLSPLFFVVSSPLLLLLSRPFAIAVFVSICAFLVAATGPSSALLQPFHPIGKLPEYQPRAHSSVSQAL
ncbi:hypothetical protein [Peribacillus butanolivorans]|uniref:hypothetical protein n=1 Tax=Peribacillus butanolivorans TaxID=421767 RepID=UPI0036DA0332